MGEQHMVLLPRNHWNLADVEQVRWFLEEYGRGLRLVLLLRNGATEWKQLTFAVNPEPARMMRDFLIFHLSPEASLINRLKQRVDELETANAELESLLREHGIVIAEVGCVK